jgi:hypothetical protein
MTDDNKQPPWLAGKAGNSMAGIPRFQAGGKRSVRRLETLNFDPIGELVASYRKLEEEIAYQEKLRSGAIVEMNPGTGRARAYRPELHHAMFDRKIVIAEKLLRYGYGRVPETTFVEEKKPQALIVNLTKKGETYVINGSDEGPLDEY